MVFSHECCVLCEGPHSEAEEQHGEKGSTETKCCEKTTTPIPHPAALPVESGVKLNWREERGVEMHV